MVWLSHLKGKQAELQACHYLEARGLGLITKNFRCYHGEIDLIMRDKDDIVFVEVRSRNRNDFGNALESIDQHKVGKLIKTASYFLQTKKWCNKVTGRFDVVTIHPRSADAQIEWIKHAFTMDEFAHGIF